MNVPTGKGKKKKEQEEEEEKRGKEGWCPALSLERLLIPSFGHGLPSYSAKDRRAEGDLGGKMPKRKEQAQSELVVPQNLD